MGVSRAYIAFHAGRKVGENAARLWIQENGGGRDLPKYGRVCPSCRAIVEKEGGAK